MEITKQEYEKWHKDQIGKPCEIHGSIIQEGKWGSWCPNKTEFGTWCQGNLYPNPNNEQLIIK